MSVLPLCQRLGVALHALLLVALRAGIVALGVVATLVHVVDSGLTHLGVGQEGVVVEALAGLASGLGLEEDVHALDVVHVKLLCSGCGDGLETDLERTEAVELHTH